MRLAPAVVVCGLLLTACSSGPASTTGTAGDPSTQPLTVVGTITLTGPYSAGAAGGTCSGTAGFADLKAGTPVTVAGADGTTVATGSVGTSVAGGEDGTDTQTCAFSFSVPRVPRGESAYELRVAERGGTAYSEAELGRPVTLYLGNG